MTRQIVNLLDIEVELFLEALFRRHGYDFRHYAKASIKRRVAALAAALGAGSVAELIPRTLRDGALLPEILAGLSVPVTEMFRDPAVFRNLREQVLPQLAELPRLKIWQAGCASGEEAYSLAVLLDEEGLLERSQIYATDINDLALKQAEDGIYPLAGFEAIERRHAESGGRRPFSDYCVTDHGYFRMAPRLRERVAFAHHDLVSDGAFCEAQLVVCRNVLIYFNHDLQERVVRLLRRGLAHGGFLCLGTRESLRFGQDGQGFSVVHAEHRIFRRAAPGAHAELPVAAAGGLPAADRGRRATSERP